MIKWNEIYASPCLGSKNAFAMPTSWSSEWTDWTASSYMLMVFIHYYLPSTTHTHTRNGPEHLTLGRPQEKFQLGEKLTVYSFRFFTRCGQIHYHSCTWAPTTRGKISVQKVAGSSAAKLRAWFGSSGMHHFNIYAL